MPTIDKATATIVSSMVAAIYHAGQLHPPKTAAPRSRSPYVILARGSGMGALSSRGARGRSVQHLSSSVCGAAERASHRPSGNRKEKGDCRQIGVGVLGAVPFSILIAPLGYAAAELRIPTRQMLADPRPCSFRSPQAPMPEPRASSESPEGAPPRSGGPPSAT